MSKYTSKYCKVTDIDVLKKYCEIQREMNSIGCWCDAVSMDFLAKQLSTSKYQIQKAYESLKERGFIKLEKIPTMVEDYDNGLYTESVTVLFTKAYVPTAEGYEEVEKLWN